MFSKRGKASSRPRRSPSTVATPTISNVVGNALSTLGKKKTILSHEKNFGIFTSFDHSLVNISEY
jgi:hypothetical protein